MDRTPSLTKRKPKRFLKPGEGKIEPRLTIIFHGFTWRIEILKRPPLSNLVMQWKCLGICHALPQ